MSLLKVAGTTASSGQLYVDDVFSTYLYTGNGSTQTITNGIDLAGKGGMVWGKNRNAQNHNLQDTQVGITNRLISNLTVAAAAVGDISSVTASGFVLTSVGNQINTSGESYASWTFRKAAKFFDVVTYTGNGFNQNIAHSLGITPGMIIIKSTSTAGTNWSVWHRSIPDDYLVLNLTQAANAAGASRTVTSSTFQIFGNFPDEGTNARTYVAYLFAHDTSSTGIIQCGSFTTNAFPGNATVNLGWEPQYLMIKPSSGGGPWRVIDTMRGISLNGNDAVLFPNLVDAETLIGTASINATGFISDDGSGSTTYIYMAIRRPNKPPTSGAQVFGLNARTGTGANATVTGGQVDDAVLIKNRGSAVGDLFASRLTGTGYLETSSTAAEVAAGTTILQANPWDVMDGVKVGTTSTITNASANTFINYLFKRAPGFFDVVCYTGTGSATTQAHNLGVVPELMIVKNRSVAGYSWVVYDVASGNTKAMLLNTTGASTAYAPPVWNDTSPTATVFSVGTSPNNNTSGATYVAYLFATLAGISKVGSYTGNGTGQAIACGFSAGARFVLIKRTDSTGNWYTFDSARGLTSGSSPYLLLNSTAAETTGNNGVYASTGGFTLGATAITTTNIATATYIFLAVS